MKGLFLVKCLLLVTVIGGAACLFASSVSSTSAAWPTSKTTDWVVGTWQSTWFLPAIAFDFEVSLRRRGRSGFQKEPAKGFLLQIEFD